MLHLCNGIRNERFNLKAIIAVVNDPADAQGASIIIINNCLSIVLADGWYKRSVALLYSIGNGR